MSDNSKLSIDHMVEMAIGLSMGTMFAKAMSSAYDNTSRMLSNKELQSPPKYIHAIIAGEQKGPFTIGEITAMIQSGDITPETYMWKPGMSEWKKAKEITEINPDTNSTPAPSIP